MNILTQNGKMRKSSQNGIDIFNFGIPAFQSRTGLQTCPNARQCAVGCYARSGTYRFGNVVNAYEERLNLTQQPEFSLIMIHEIASKSLKSKAKGNKCLIRIHDSGDFYNETYLNEWLKVIQASPSTHFYAYTKMVQMLQRIKPIQNFTVIYSLGGSEDSHIDTSIHRHSRVFENETDLLDAGYTDATQDDTVAALGPNPKIGLVYHGTKHYKNTTWSKVS